MCPKMGRCIWSFRLRRMRQSPAVAADGHPGCHFWGPRWRSHTGPPGLVPSGRYKAGQVWYPRWGSPELVGPLRSQAWCDLRTSTIPSRRAPASRHRFCRPTGNGGRLIESQQWRQIRNHAWYSRFLLQALERTVTAQASVGFQSWFCRDYHGTIALLARFCQTSMCILPHLWSTRFSQPVSSSPSLSTVTKPTLSPRGLVASNGLPLSSLEPSAHTQQLTPSQELTEQLDKQHTSPPLPPHTPKPTRSHLSFPKVQRNRKGRKRSRSHHWRFLPAASRTWPRWTQPRLLIRSRTLPRLSGHSLKGAECPWAFSSDSGERWPTAYRHRLRISGL